MDILNIQDGTYRTPPGRRGKLLARISPTASFFLRYPWIIFRAAWIAKHRGLTGARWAQASVEVLQAAETAGCQFEIAGVNHLRGINSPCIVAANHMSTMETMVLPSVLQPLRETTFVVKRSLTTMPVFKHVMNSRNAIAVSQTNPREDLKTMLVEGLDRLQQGYTLVVFPQGSRTLGFEAARFNSIAVKLASRAGVPLVPCAVATDAWGLGRWVPELAKIDPSKPVRVEFGEPMTVTGRGEAEHARTLEFISQRLAAWGYDVDI